MTSATPEVDKVVKGVLDNAQKKLIIAIVLCAIFMAVELVAGIFAHSLAILTDAAHMLSDVCSFGISLFAIHISGLPGTMKMSFGYARAEILGALISILLIWGLTLWLVGEAVNRIINPQEVKAPIMVYTAIFGIITNIALASVLDHHHHHHGGHGHHSHGHSHHHSHGGHCHRDQVSKADAPQPLTHEHTHHTYAEASANTHAEPEQLQVTSTKLNPHPENASLVASVASSLSPSAHSGSVLLDELPTPSAGAAAESYRAAATMLKDLSRRSIGTPCDSTRRQSKFKSQEVVDDIYVSIEDEPHSQATSETSIGCDGHSHSKNINVSAAYLHALGDLLQNLGVLVGGLVIWWKPTWTVADPICTLLFSVLVFSTTFGILRDAANVLMEGTPSGIDPSKIVADLRTIPNVSEVHDVHVWSLSVGKPSLACHIVIDDPTKAKRVLASATSLIQVKHLILHTTIQIDFSSNKSSCETDAHVKCH